VILDNADTYEAAESAEDLLPRLWHGHVMVTSRLNEWSGSFQPFDLELLARETTPDAPLFSPIPFLSGLEIV
jgi:hypothetical protein